MGSEAGDRQRQAWPIVWATMLSEALCRRVGRVTSEKVSKVTNNVNNPSGAFYLAVVQFDFSPSTTHLAVTSESGQTLRAEVASLPAWR